MWILFNNGWTHSPAHPFDCAFLFLHILGVVVLAIAHFGDKSFNEKYIRYLYLL